MSLIRLNGAGSDEVLELMIDENNPYDWIMFGLLNDLSPGFGYYGKSRDLVKESKRNFRISSKQQDWWFFKDKRFFYLL